MTGMVLNEAGQAQLKALSEHEITQAALFFQGGYDQVPPMYSAKQIGGKRLYDLAREGKVVERKPVHVEIPKIEIEEISLPLVTLKIDCSKGTYIRTLCADIGERLGVGGAMEHLERLRVGGFFIGDSLSLGRIEALSKSGELAPYVIPCEEMFLDCLRVRTIPEADRKLLNGNELTMRELGLPPRGGGDMIRVCDSAGTFYALYRQMPSAGTYRPYRMLRPPEE
jgi:tRNA pseudouridine55 synthase